MLPHEWVCDGNSVDGLVFTDYGELWHRHDGVGTENAVMCITGRFFFRQLRQRIYFLASMPLNIPLNYAVAHTTNFVGSEWGVGVVTH